MHFLFYFISGLRVVESCYYLENGPKKEERGLRNIHLKLLEYMCSITMLRMYIPTRTLNSIEILSLFSRVLVTSLFSTQIPNDFIQFKVSLDLKCLGQHLSSSDKKYSVLIFWFIFDHYLSNFFFFGYFMHFGHFSELF